MAAPSQTPTGPEYEQSFLRILNNKSKYETSPSQAPRERGFVVLVRGGTGGSLKPLQDLCLDSNRQHHNVCFTARYRLQPKMAIGTLLCSWLADLTRILNDPGALAGDLRPIVEDRESKGHSGSRINRGETPLPPNYRWPAMANQLLMFSGDLDRELWDKGSGAIDRERLGILLKPLEDESILPLGTRLILFGELSEEATDETEWTTAIDFLFRQLPLPERVGLVFSGAPKNVSLPRDDPHFLEITVPDDYGASAQATLAYRYKDSSFHSDVPAGKDELGVNSYANAIARFVLHPQTKPPITIGIHGKWGKGKSSFMKLIDSALVKYAEVNRASNTQKWNDLAAKLIQAESIPTAIENAKLDDQGRERQRLEYKKLQDEEGELWQEMCRAAQKNVLRIRFNAWQFEDAKQTWAGLASEISEAMEGLLPSHSHQWLKLKYAWKHRRAEIVLNVLIPIIVFLLIGLLFVFGIFNLVAPNDNSAVGSLLKFILPAGSMILTFWYLGSQFVKVAQPISARVISYIAMPNYREQMGFQHRVKDDLKFVYDFVATRLNTSALNRAGTFRVVIYIDDLDRCSESKIMELLQAINLILADCEFFVFVGMDTEMIYRAINSYYKEDPGNRLADDYLSKIIQISFHLPPSKLQARTRYLGTLFSLSSRLELANRAAPTGPLPTISGRGQGVANGKLPYDMRQLLKIVPVQIKEAEDTSDELEAFSDHCDFLDDNPREIKRLINIHRLIKILVQNPNTPLDTDRQKKLVKWLIFCDVWPHLVGHILDPIEPLRGTNCLLELANSLAAAAKNPKATELPPKFERLKEFAEFLPSTQKPTENLSPEERQLLDKQIVEEKRIYTLTAADIDDEFRQAAKLSLMIRKPVHRSPTHSEKQQT